MLKLLAEACSDTCSGRRISRLSTCVSAALRIPVMAEQGRSFSKTTIWSRSLHRLDRCPPPALSEISVVKIPPLVGSLETC